MDNILDVNVNGFTTINHSVRKSLHISMAEYVMLDFLEIIKKKRITYTESLCYIKTGLSAAEQNKILLTLISKNLCNDSLNVTSLWIDAFGNLSGEFEAFWNKTDAKGIVKSCWTGSKKDAFDKYCKTRKKYSSDYLLSQRDHYFNFLDHTNSLSPTFQRAKMGCSVFLSMTTQRFTEDFESQYPSKQTKTSVPIDVMIKDDFFK